MHKRDIERSVRTNIPLGMPMNMQHDMHRLVGWARPLGLYLDAYMVRSLGQFEKPTQENERAGLNELVSRYWTRHHSEGTETSGGELKDRLSPACLDEAELLNMEAIVVSRVGIAAELYPDLFTPGQYLVDKDGLTDYRDLQRKMKQIQPGVFHDRERDVLLFAHRYFRRSMSHRNKLNTYFLQSFNAIANRHGELRVRIKLDPDIIGHPGSAREIIEMEYWHGPQYNDAITEISTGVAEYKASDRTREYHGIDRTHIWWKDPKMRKVEGEEDTPFRTFEIEELIENESWGIGANKFGCRYAHSEFSSESDAITHFDGAIRAYDAEKYYERIDTLIDKAGKHSEYTKLFRLDGLLPISDWKRLLSDYFQGNDLIPEYFGSLKPNEEIAPSLKQAATESVIDQPHLVAFISLDRGSINRPLGLHPELLQQIGSDLIRFLEIGVGAVEKYLRSIINLDAITTVGFEDKILNLSRLCFGSTTESNNLFDRVANELSVALRKDIESDLIRRASIPLMWEVDGLLLTLTIVGEAKLVADTLERLSDVIDISNDPSKWIEEFSELIKTIAPKASSPITWHEMRNGTISNARSGTVEQRLRMPNDIKEKLISSGSLNISNNTGIQN